MVSPLTTTGQSLWEPRAPSRDVAEQAKELEGVFLNTLVKEMFADLDSDSMFSGGFAEETWRGMQSEQYAAVIAEAGGIGLAAQLTAELIQMQAASRPTASTLLTGAYKQ